MRVNDVRVIDTIDIRSYANREIVWGGNYVPGTRRTAQGKYPACKAAKGLKLAD